jgi:catechol 2,3-dioxygenase-like lactoylglutathione lyase family enzyme
MKIMQLNHAAIHVTDLEKSRRFYAEVLGLKPISRPAFGFPGAWFRIGIDQELHLIAREVSPNAPPPTDRHFAMVVDSIDDAERLLREKAVEFRGPKPRPDGVQQIFLTDPDGYVIELSSAPKT